MKALVTGATGYVGSRLVPVLLAAGWQVLAGARTPDKLDQFDTTDDAAVLPATPHSSPSGDSSSSSTAVPVALDVMDEDSCRAALSDHGRVDVAYYLVHGIGEGDFASTDLTGARAFAAAATAAGVRRIVYLGGLVPDGEELSEHLASRKAVAEALGAAPRGSNANDQHHEKKHDKDRGGGPGGRGAEAVSDGSDPDASAARGPDLVWLRAAIVLGAGSTSYELVRHLVDRLPLIPTPTWMRHRVQPIAVDDVLHYLLAAADSSLPAGAYDIGGPQALPYRDLVALQARVSGHRRVLVPVAGVSTAVAARVIAAVVPLPHELVVDLVGSLNNTMVVGDDRITALVPPPPGGLTPLEQALRRAAASPGDADLRGAGRTRDPLHRTTTDPDWAASSTDH